MGQYNSVLFISQGSVEESLGLKQALNQARIHQAPLKVLVVVPQLPKAFAKHKESFEHSQKAKVHEAVEATFTALNIEQGTVGVSVALLLDKTPAVEIIQCVKSEGHDLVIKNAQTSVGERGFKALDMDLLRKCPCALWLCRPTADNSGELERVVVAVDPESDEPGEHALSKRLIRSAFAQTQLSGGSLHVMSCWDYEFESELRSNIFIQIPEDEIKEQVQEAKQAHFSALETLITEAGVAGECQIHQLRGEPDTIIPEFVSENRADLLVMGTVARTGIPGFVIGNTAEDILQKVPCSLLALKPKGFNA